MKMVTVAEASRQLSAVLREVAQGGRVMVTWRGKPVAIIEPVRRARAARAGVAKLRLLARLARAEPVGVRDWARVDLYEQ